MPDKRLIFSQEEIAGRVRELGGVLTRDYSGRDLLVIGVLNGSFMFMADLVRAIRLDLQIDFIRAASYGMSTSSSGEVTILKEVALDIRDRNILVVEDIVDTGLTLSCLLNYFIERGAGSVRTCALIDKKERRRVGIKIDYTGFEVREGFLVGYGLDCRERYRQLAGVYCLDAPDSKE